MFTEKDLELFKAIPDAPKRNRTILDIAQMPHYENVISNFYAYYLNPTEDHGLGTLFTESLLEVLNRQSFLQPEQVEITREESTKEGKRIDLLLSDSQNHHIIIENKIYHWLANDIDKYWAHVKVPDIDKIGIILTLKEEKLDAKWRGLFLNITHKQWMDVVEKKLENFALSQRQEVFIYDFLQAIKNLSGDFYMNKQVQCYFEQRDILSKAFVASNAAIDFVNHQLDLLASEMSMNINQQGKNSQRFRYLWFQEKREIYYTITYDQLWKDPKDGGEMSLTIILEVYERAFRERSKFAHIIEGALPPGMKKEGDSGSSWQHYLFKKYPITIEELKELPTFLRTAIETDFDDLFSQMIEVLYGDLKLHEAMEKVLKEMPNQTGTFDEIAKRINEQNLYRRNDGKPVPSYQIRQRALASGRNYSRLFAKEGNDGIKLVV